MFGWSRLAAASASGRNRRTSAAEASCAGQDHLQRDDPVERLLPGLVDDAHAAAGDLGEQLYAIPACSSAKSTSTATPTSTWSRPSARTAAPSSASSRTSAARTPSSPPAASNASPARWPATPSGRWSCPNSPPATLINSLASASAGPCCSAGCGSRPAAGPCSRNSWRGRGFEFDVERAVFATVLHRLFVSGSDRACDKWMEDYAIPGSDGLALHHLYRAMAWLGEELDAAEGGQAHATPFAPRCVKDRIEEALFARRRDLFSELSVVFMDTTSLRFEGAGGETPRPARPLQGPPARPDADGPVRGDRRRGAADLHGDRGPATPPMSGCCCRRSTACAAASPSAGSASWPTAA